MTTIIDRASQRGHFDHGWLNTYHTFSFANYYNPERMNFGALRVLNDDTVTPDKGFDMHPHNNMEVISIPLKGYLTHGDSVENTSTITPGEIQVMSTGNGILHSEYNGSKTENLEFLQIWIFPKAKDTTPSYKNYDIRRLLINNELSVFIAPNTKGIPSILQDAWFSMGTFDTEKTIEYKIHKENNGVYIFIIKGEIDINKHNLKTRDGIGIRDVKDFKIKINPGTHILFIEVPM